MPKPKEGPDTAEQPGNHISHDEGHADQKHGQCLASDHYMPAARQTPPANAGLSLALLSNLAAI